MESFRLRFFFRLSQRDSLCFTLSLFPSLANFEQSLVSLLSSFPSPPLPFCTMLARAFSGLAVSTPAPARRNPSLASTSSVRGTALLSPRSGASATPTARGSVVVFAKQNALQRQRLAEKQRVYNKARKSAVATRIKKVCAGDGEGGGSKEGKRRESRRRRQRR